MYIQNGRNVKNKTKNDMHDAFAFPRWWLTARHKVSWMMLPWWVMQQKYTTRTVCCFLHSRCRLMQCPPFNRKFELSLWEVYDTKITVHSVISTYHFICWGRGVSISKFTSIFKWSAYIFLTRLTHHMLYINSATFHGLFHLSPDGK